MSQQVRDSVARLDGWAPDNGGWRRSTGDGCAHNPGPYHDGYSLPLCRKCGAAVTEPESYHWQSEHPVPDTLDACAKAWDDYAGGLVTCANAGYWHARDRRTGMGVKATRRTGYDAESERRDKWSLLGKILEGM